MLTSAPISMMPPSLVMSCCGGTLKAESLTIALMHLQLVSFTHTFFLVTLFAQNISCVMSPVQPGEDEDSARTLGTCKLSVVTMIMYSIDRM